MGFNRRSFFGRSAAAVPTAVALPLVGSLTGEAAAVTPGVAATPADAAPAPVPTLAVTSAAQQKLGTVSAKVSPRLLQKADRLFGGNVEGRMAELLQNSRRAGAKHVAVTCTPLQGAAADGKTGAQFLITLEDDGHGIEDFGQLLSLGHSGWGDDIEAAEDPAGAGFFSLAPRDVTVLSRGREVQIEKGGWLGMEIRVQPSSYTKTGVMLRFIDDQPWDYALVEKQVCFSGMTCTINGRLCEPLSAIDPDKPSTHLPELGVRVQLLPSNTPSSDRRRKQLDLYGTYRNDVVINFHGQIIKIDDSAASSIPTALGYKVVVDLTGEPTPLRMKLPDRSSILENKYSQQLYAEISKLALRALLASGKAHHLTYAQYTLSHEYGIMIPEAAPTYLYGLGHWPNGNDGPSNYSRRGLSGLQPMELGELEADSAGRLLDLLEANVDDEVWPYRGVSVQSQYVGYSWSKDLPELTEFSFDVKPQKSLLTWSVNGGDISVYDKIVAVLRVSDRDEPFLIELDYAPESDTSCCVTREMLESEDNEDMLYKLTGGDNEDSGDTEKQWEDFQEDLKAMRCQLVGPLERPRQKLVEAVEEYFNAVSRSTAGQNRSLSVLNRVLVNYDSGEVKLYTNDRKVHSVKMPG